MAICWITRSIPMGRQLRRFCSSAGEATPMWLSEQCDNRRIGTLVVNGDGSFTFTPAPNYDGAVPLSCTRLPMARIRSNPPWNSLSRQSMILLIRARTSW
ncbi:cadherin-like domain-containing protein [Aeromonas hydrophila]|uniref:cadherin-like domain-containing protein n=1 Tax=Aeromonas hydrophila TaxID=644 RepID=UPI002AB2CCB9|nr:cadherin-like domain-containing protein [Aeromonas hydrophila]